MKRIIIIFFAMLFSFSANAINLPTILSDEDAEIYREIFRLQDANRFEAAAKLESKLSDKILMGEVLYQRYMARGYISSLTELNRWMANYSRHPGAETIHRLARRKGGTNLTTRAPQTPTLLAARDDKAMSETFTSGTYSKAINGRIAEFRRHLRRGKTLNARNVLEEPAVKRALSPADYGRLAGRLAFIYYTDGRFDLAGEWGHIAAEAGSEYGLWTMGLLSFKDERFEAAAEYFAKILDLKHIGDARKIEAGFWAGRAAAAAGNDRAAKRFWRDSSRNPQSFYGALSVKMLGGKPKFQFFEEELNRSDLAEIMKHSHGMRGLALMQIDQHASAERHFRFLMTNDASDRLLHAVHTLAKNHDLPRTALQLGRITREKGILEIDPGVISAAQYPIPNWDPLKGWSVDRALVFAIIRQESAFAPAARSHAGAQGVMQLMPKTARNVARQNRINLNALDLHDPNHNVYLGQTLINKLLARSHIDNNLIKLLASYNAGEGRMLNWERRFTTNDPLLYIESFPAYETREYIKLVMSNLWLYRARLDQPLTTMTYLAEGKWPIHSSYDDMAALNAKDNSKF
ncbi:MAG: lytic transglycosylase domain-containing protein [Alphaproteobacteria bacterium]|nr:lytic transglycosylase domain-containing protein [Alphaproteobacteria bacterium]